MPFVAIVGASGFVGRRLVNDFCARGSKVRAFSRTPVAVNGKVDVRTMPDLRLQAEWGEAFDSIDAVIFCAARVHVLHDTSDNPLAEFRRVNRDGALAAARAAASAGVQHFVFLSSIKVNGEGTLPNQPYRADDVPAPTEPYGVSKREAEDALLALATKTGMRVSIVRPPLVYGPGVRANMAALMKLAVRGVPMPLGAVGNRRSLVFVGNLSALVQRLVEATPDADRTYLVSDGEDLSTGQLYAAMARAAGKRAMLLPVPGGLITAAASVLGRGDYARRLFGSLTVDIAPTRDALGWIPPFSIEHGIGETVRAFIADRKA